jgi:hypothetical protein
MTFVGTYQGLSVIQATEKEYFEQTSLKDRYDDKRCYLVDNNLVSQGKIIAQRQGGYIVGLDKPKVFSRPEPEEIRTSTGWFQPVEIEKTEEKPKRGLRAETPVIDEYDPAASKAVDEYLASKKSVDYFFEEIKKEASSN